MGIRYLKICIILIAISTALFHGIFATFYVARFHSDQYPHTPDINKTEEDFLSSYIGKGDEIFYNKLAISIMKTGLPKIEGEISFHSIIYPYFLSLIFLVGKIKLLPVIIAQAISEGIISFVIGILTWKIKNDASAAIIASLLFLFNLRFAMYVGYIYPTTLSMLFIALLLYASASINSKSYRSTFLFSGITVILTYPSYITIIIPAVIWSLLYKKSAKTYLPLVILTAFKIALPFFTNSSIPANRADKGGILWEGNNPKYENMKLYSIWRQPQKVDENTEYRYNSYLERAAGSEIKAALLWIYDNPLQYLKLCFIRMKSELGSFTGNMSFRNRIVSTVYWLLIFPAGIYALWILRSAEISKLVLLTWFFITVSGIFIITEWYLRYRLPVELSLIPYASITYTKIFHYLKDQYKNKRYLATNS